MGDKRVIRYEFMFRGGIRRGFTLELESPTGRLIPAANKESPGWVKLTCSQCSNCPLKPESDANCPVAANLVPVVMTFRECKSFDLVDVTVHTEEREYHKNLPLGDGLGSLIGIIMVTSGCPVLDHLRPMVHTHLPFATPEETTYRAISMYLTAQYLLQRRGEAPDWSLERLRVLYDEIRKVNQGFAGRLQSLHIKDAAIAALVNHLDGFATLVSTTLTDGWWSELEAQFYPYVRPL